MAANQTACNTTNDAGSLKRERLEVQSDWNQVILFTTEEDVVRANVEIRKKSLLQQYRRGLIFGQGQTEEARLANETFRQT